jgi:hypothetical protein
MKERRGPLVRTVGLVAETVAGTVRRRRQGRMPRALVYDTDGHPRLVPPGGEAHERLVEIAETLVALAAEERGGEPDPADDPLEE